MLRTELSLAISLYIVCLSHLFPQPCKLRHEGEVEVKNNAPAKMRTANALAEWRPVAAGASSRQWPPLTEIVNLEKVTNVCGISFYLNQEFKICWARKIMFIRLTIWRRNYYFFLILAHPIYKMRITQEPNTLEL